MASTNGSTTNGSGGVVAPTAPVFGLAFVPDIDFAIKDPTVIQTEVINDYQAAFLALTNIAKILAPGDPVRLHLLAVCAWLSEQRVIIDFTGKNNLLKYAHDAYLDNLAALYGNRTLRLQAAPATCTLRFTLTAALAFDAVIPAGTQCQGPNAVLFATAGLSPTGGTGGGAIIPAGQLTVDVQATCVTPGVIGNGFAIGQVNSIVNWNQPWSVGVSNTTVTGGGSDIESDDQYRYRVWLAIESFSTCGPHDAYEFWALSADPSIIQCVVYSAPDIAGEVHLFPLCKDSNGLPILPSSDVLAKVLASCSADTRRPVSDYVTAYAPTTFNYSVNVTYYVSEANEVLLGTIQPAVVQAVNDYIIWQGSFIGRDINTDELIKRMLEAGAKRVVVTAPSPGYQALAYNQLAILSDGTPGGTDPGLGTAVPTITFGGIEPE